MNNADKLSMTKRVNVRIITRHDENKRVLVMLVTVSMMHLFCAYDTSIEYCTPPFLGKGHNIVSCYPNNVCLLPVSSVVLFTDNIFKKSTFTVIGNEAMILQINFRS